MMGSTASACAAAVANVLISSKGQRGQDGVHVQQVFTDGELTDPAAPTWRLPTIGDVSSKDIIRTLRAHTHNAVHPVPSEPVVSGRPACCLVEVTPTSTVESLHAFTEDLKRKTELIEDSVYELVSQDYPDVEFVFFHGLQPDHEETVHAFWRTWRMRFSEECWLTALLPKLLNHTDREIKPRVLSVSYENSSKLGFKSWMASPIDRFNTSEKLMMDLIMKGRRAVGQKHNVPVILVGHDLGGIMIKHFLIKVKKTLAAENLAAGMKRNLRYFWENVSALVFYATPQIGYSTIDDKIPRNSSSPSLQFLRALSNDTTRVNKEFENFRKYKNPIYQIPSLRIWESAKTYQGRYNNELVVPRHVIRGTDSEDYTALWEDHFQVCQPTGLHSFTARRFARFVVQLIELLREDEQFV